MFIFKCGNCGKEFSVDEERIKPNDDRYCANCGSRVPYKIKLLAESTISVSKHIDSESWQLYRIPEKYSKAQVTLTLPLE